MKRFSMVAEKQGLDYARIPSMVWIVATILIASSSAPACLDPPEDPPLLTEVEVNTLTFLTNQDDGLNGLAELRVMFTIDYGPGQCTTPALWAMDHNFDTIQPPFSPIPPPMMIGSHIECTPAADPRISVYAWESDQGIHPLIKLLAALAGHAVGGTAGQLAARLIVGILSFFNADDPLYFDVDYTMEGSFGHMPLPDGPCSAIAAGYSATMGAAYRAAAEYSSDQEIADMYREYATYGVDDDHPFSRNASYASQRFAYLFQAIEEADALTIEPGESGDVEPAKQAVRETAVDMAQIVADATLTEATTMGLDPTLLSKAQSLINSAEVYASAGNYHSAISFYEDATILLLPEMFPEFILFDFYPPDGAVDIPLDAKLCWPKSEEAESYDVYFGTNFDHVKYGRVGTFKGSQLGTTYDPGTLEPCYDYYWKIEPLIEEEEEEEPPIIVDSVITTGEVRIYDNMYSSGEAVLGDVWSFTTAGRKATNPYPVDGAICVDPNVLLSWTPGCLAAFHDVYFGTDFYAVANADTSDTTGIYRARLDVNSYDPGGLEPGTAYYWKIHGVNEVPPDSPWQGDVWSFMTAGKKATNPYPVDGAIHVDPNAILSWTPGCLAAFHDVYFGTDFYAVANADTSDTTGIYRARLNVNSYDPGGLEPGTAYYWKIHGVNEVPPDSPWQGDVWSFMTAACLFMDDMESYTDDLGNRIFETWIDGLGYTDSLNLYHIGNMTGSRVNIDSVTVHEGAQSMRVDYDNSSKLPPWEPRPPKPPPDPNKPPPDPNKPTIRKAFYSEAERSFDTPQDWARCGVTALSLWFYGDPSNDPEPMYVAVEDTTGMSAVVVHDNPAAAQTDTWTEWSIDPRQFADQGMNLADVSSIAIGFGDRDNPTPGGTGTVYFDDIQLRTDPCPIAGDPNECKVFIRATISGKYGDTISPSPWTFEEKVWKPVKSIEDIYLEDEIWYIVIDFENGDDFWVDCRPSHEKCKLEFTQSTSKEGMTTITVTCTARSPDE